MRGLEIGVPKTWGAYGEASVASIGGVDYYYSVVQTGFTTMGEYYAIVYFAGTDGSYGYTVLYLA